MVGTQALAVGLLLQRMAEHGDLCAQSVCQLDTHVSEAAQADDRDFLPRPRIPVLQRRVQRDPGA